MILALMSSKATFAIGAGVVSQLAVLASEVHGSGDRGRGLLLAAAVSAQDSVRCRHPMGGRRPPPGAHALRLGSDPLRWRVHGHGLGADARSRPGLRHVAHFGGGAQWTLSTYGLQLRVDDAVLGRVMAGDFAIVTLVLSITSVAAGALVVGDRCALGDHHPRRGRGGCWNLLPAAHPEPAARCYRRAFRRPVMTAPPHLPMDDARTAETIERIFFELRKVIVGQSRLLERILVGLLSSGHCLLESVPGLAKTLAAETLANVVGGTFARIQFTPDLLPSDIVGTRIYRGSTEKFDVELGPVFVNFLLTDEINRAPAKVQSALLEVMQERQVTIGGITHPVPNPFFVVATQNPIESEGVYQLPDAQRDRFMMKVVLDHPSAAEELVILDRMAVNPPVAEQVIDLDELIGLQRRCDAVFVDRSVAQYAVDLVQATRYPAAFGLGELRPSIALGASPRRRSTSSAAPGRCR